MANPLFIPPGVLGAGQTHLISDVPGAPPAQAGPPPTTPELRAQAIDQMKSDTIKSATVFVSLAYGLGQFLYPRNPKLAEALAHEVTSMRLEPVPGKPVARPSLGKVTLLGLGPAPLGYVPPEAFGLRPDFLVAGELRKPKEQQREIGLSVLTLLGGNPGGARQQYADAKLADEVAVQTRLRASQVNVSTLQNAVTNPIDLLPPGAPLVFRPEEIRQIAVDELARRGIAVPEPPALVATIPPVVAVTPDTSTPVALPPVVPQGDPLNVKPINDAGIRNGNAATGINRELVHERADP